MGWLKSLFGGDKMASQRRDDYNIAISPYMEVYKGAVNAARPTDLAFSAGFGNAYTNLGREQAARAAAQRYRAALSPAFMRSAAGRAQAADVSAQTAGVLAREQAANRLALEQLQLAQQQQNWQNRMAYAGLTGQQLGYGQQIAGQNYAMQEQEAQRKHQARMGALQLGVGLAGSLLGPTVAGIGGAVASNLGFGLSGGGKNSYGGGKNSLSMYKAAAGVKGHRGDVMVGDGGTAPELVLNPTGAPLTVVPLTSKTTSRWVNIDSMLPQRTQQRKSAFEYLPRYACGGKTTRPAFIAGEGR